MIDKKLPLSPIPKSTEHHLVEIHGSVQLGIAASCIPFPQHNAAPRVAFSTHHMKAAIGTPAPETDEKRRAFQLWYPERPLVGTVAEEIFGLSRVPPGINCLTAIMCWEEAAQEDSLIVKQDALNMGLFYSTCFNQWLANENMVGQERHEFRQMPPHECIGAKKSDYSNIEADGIIGVGSHVHSDTILVQQVLPLRGSGGAIKYRDTSLQMNVTDYGIVHRVVLSSKDENNLRSVTVHTHRTCRPIPGDKFVTRHGQKGIMGMAAARQDLPFDEQGRVPDIIISPTAFISRQTYGQLLEGLLACVCAVTGIRGDATPHSQAYRECLYRYAEDRQDYFVEPQDKLEEIKDALRRLGLNDNGECSMTSGITGEPLRGRIFMTDIYFLALKHQASAKIRARARGCLNSSNHQPLAGRKRGGGLRFGEMEKDAIAAHGASGMVQDKLLFSSDPHWRHICRQCGFACLYSDYNQKTTFCKYCMQSNTGLKVQTSYSFKRFDQELMACGMGVRYKVQPALEEGQLEETTSIPPLILVGANNDHDPTTSTNTKKTIHGKKRKSQTSEHPIVKKKRKKKPTSTTAARAVAPAR